MKKWLILLASTVGLTLVLYALPRWIKGPWPCVEMSYDFREIDWPEDPSTSWPLDEQLRPILERHGVDLSQKVFLRGQNDLRLLSLVALGREQQKMLQAFPNAALPDVSLQDNRLNFSVIIDGRIYGIRENVAGHWSEPHLPRTVNELIHTPGTTWNTVIHFGTPDKPQLFRAQGEIKPGDFEHSGLSFLGVKYGFRRPFAICYEGRAWPVLLFAVAGLHLLAAGLYRPLGRALRLGR